MVVGPPVAVDGVHEWNMLYISASLAREHANYLTYTSALCVYGVGQPCKKFSPQGSLATLSYGSVQARRPNPRGPSTLFPLYVTPTWGGCVCRCPWTHKETNLMPTIP
eukprot:1158599-Pelagomonas_calceolata.AAC.13